MSEQQVDTEPPMSLPKPQGEQVAPAETGQYGAGGENVQATGLETGTPGNPVAAPSVQGQASPVGQTSTIMPVSPVNPGAYAVQGAGGLPPIADDVDLIEKEWVDKAKEIVERTRSDPYAQNKEMTSVKADYLKKRYNKDLKPAEE